MSRSSALEALHRILSGIRTSLQKRVAPEGRVTDKGIDQNQVALYDLAWLQSESEAAMALSEALERLGSESEPLGDLFVVDTLRDVVGRLTGRSKEFGVESGFVDKILRETGSLAWLEENSDPEKFSAIASTIADTQKVRYGLTEEQEMIRDTFKRFAEDRVIPIAEKIHREDRLVPEDLINGLKELGCFGLSIPQKYGGFQDDQKPDHTAMVIATEELSRGSLGIAGSLITRPEILAKALLKGGTEEQKQKWLPRIASGEKMVAIAVTEPDYGSDVAGIQVTAQRSNGFWKLNGTKTWCTFAGYADTLLVLARTDPDPDKRHKGLSILIAEKPRFKGHEFEHVQPNGGRISGAAIGTMGYRGMHSFEIAFENYEVPAENLVGGEAGLGKGFYLQMEGFAGGRLQTAARAVGVMQAAYEKALSYSLERKVFGQPIFNYGLTRYKLARMAATLQAARQFTFKAARLMDEGGGQIEASMVKLFASKVAESVTREAQQIHGGMGYAEEYAVSRFFVDARVFSIFEGAEEILALKVIAKHLLKN